MSYFPQVKVTPAKTNAAGVQDWTAVAQNTLVKSSEIDLSALHDSLLHVQAALTTTTAHNGTRFIVQASCNDSGDEDWTDYSEFLLLAGTALTDLIENNPLAAAATAITLTTSPFSVDNGKWLFIWESGTPANSELVRQAAYSTPTLTIIDGVTNSHAQNIAMFDIAASVPVYLDATVKRVRLIVDNTYHSAGSAMAYKFGASEVTSR